MNMRHFSESPQTLSAVNRGRFMAGIENRMEPNRASVRLFSDVARSPTTTPK
jgi:hypothetical protein